MRDNPLIEQIEAASEILDLNPAVIEKDYQVTSVIHALNEVKNDYFQLVFAGGTCLAKGHRLVKRMSEDIDFKIPKTSGSLNISKSSYLKELKEFRKELIEKLEDMDFQPGDIQSRNEGQYLSLELNYSSYFARANTLRPHLLLEFIAAEIRLPTQILPITSMLADVLNTQSFKSFPTNCISVVETAAEKWVGLTRRVAAIERGYYSDDMTLVRHIYDLSAMNIAKVIDKDLPEIAGLIVTQDAKQYKNQHPEYYQNPIKEIEQSLYFLRENPKWQSYYQSFVENMVYDQTSESNYFDALKQVEILKAKIVPHLNHNSIKIVGC